MNREDARRRVRVRSGLPRTETPEPPDPSKIRDLEAIARQLRRDVIEMITAAGSGHPGGSLSAADIIAALYFYEMRIDPGDPALAERDRFVLSKGHCCPVLYAALARAGYFDIGVLTTLRQYGSILQGHPDFRKTPGVDMTSGSLGNGLSIGIGMALGAKMADRDWRVFVMTGDGELQEGVSWEGLMAAPNLRLGNLVLIVDFNGLQNDGRVPEIMSLEPLPQKLTDFGWQVREIDGHSMPEILEALAWSRPRGDRPYAIVAHTVKGKGVSFMENRVEWHGLAPTQEQARSALEELSRGGDSRV